MFDGRNLEPDSKAILDELVNYHSSRLHEFERRRQRHLRAKSMDGQYSLTRLLNGLFEDRVAHVAPYEHACSQKIEEVVGKPPEPGF